MPASEVMSSLYVNHAPSHLVGESAAASPLAHCRCSWVGTTGSSPSGWTSFSAPEPSYTEQELPPVTVKQYGLTEGFVDCIDQPFIQLLKGIVVAESESYCFITSLKNFVQASNSLEKLHIQRPGLDGGLCQREEIAEVHLDAESCKVVSKSNISLFPLSLVNRLYRKDEEALQIVLLDPGYVVGSSLKFPHSFVSFVKFFVLKCRHQISEIKLI